MQGFDDIDKMLRDNPMPTQTESNKRFRLEECTYLFEGEEYSLGMAELIDELDEVDGVFEYDIFIGEVVDKLNELYDEKEYWKSSCCLGMSENSILWNELFCLMEQGANPSPAFEEYMETIRDKYDKRSL